MVATSLKKRLANFELAFQTELQDRLVNLPDTQKKDFEMGFKYSREYATVMPRSEAFNRGFNEGRAFSVKWYAQN
jgi:hypothetical protein